MLFNRVFKVCKLFSNAILRRANQRRFSSQLRCGSVMSETLEMRQMMSAAPADVSFAGRGEDLLLVVNPNDENALRVANAYQQLRHIPDRNIVFVEPPLENGFLDMSLDQQQFMTSIVTPIANAIRDRGLSSQIDFIGAIGLPARFSFENPNNYGMTSYQSLSYGLTELTQYVNGLNPALAQFVTTAISSADARSAVHHSSSTSVAYNDGVARGSQYYLGGLVAFTGAYGNSADQVIANLSRAAAADGTRPVGTIYFEENDGIRSETREPQWPATQAALRARGISVVQESNTLGATPSGRSDVRGAVTGYYELRLPNGSTYLPGSWADNLTSYGGAFGSGGDQTKATEFLAAGAAASSGTVEEPYAFADRFAAASIFTSIDDGLTLAEAYAHSIVRPDMSQFFGDLLAQPYADLPRVQFTAGPTEGQTVSGTLTLTVNATLSNPRVATGIARLELYVDGTLRQTINANQGTFRPDTTTLADGVNELRVIAVSNARAESEGIAIRHIVVNNRGRSVAATVPRSTAASLEMLPVNVSTTLTSGSVQRVELRHLGRTIGQVASGSGSALLDASRLAFGENQIIPVAIYSDGEQVSGAAFVMTRTPDVFAAQSVLNPVDRTAGIRAEYFLNRGAATIDASDFSGTPDIVRVHNSLQLTASDLATTSLDRLAVRFTGRIEVTGNTSSEYLFSLLGTNDSARLKIDGRQLVSFNGQTYGISQADASVSVFLAPGEHSFELLVSNMNADEPGLLRVDLRMRGPDGVTRVVDRSNAFVTTETPTPNRAPTANADSYSVTQPQRLDVTAAGVLTNDVDADGNRLTARLISRPQHGTLTLRNDGSFGYLPTANYVGLDQFSYVANDSQSDSATATVTIDVRSSTVTPPNDDFSFRTDFETQDVTAWQTHLSNPSGFNVSGTGGFTEIGAGDSIVLKETANAHSGQNALQITYAKDEDRGQAVVQIPNGGSDYVRTTQSMRFGDTFDFAFGMKIHRIWGFNEATDHSTFDIVVLAWGKSRPGFTQPDMTGINDSYLISVNANGGRNDWGGSYADFSFERGRWYELVTEVKLNTVGQSDGEVRLWIDGVKIVEKTGVVIRDESTQTINRVLYGGWYSNGASGQNPAINPASPTSLLIDDVSIATSATTPTNSLQASRIDKQTIAANAATVLLPLTVSHSDGSAVGSVQVVAQSSNSSLLSPDKIVVSGSGANWTVKATPKANQNGTATVTLIVTEGANVVRTTFDLVVTPPVVNQPGVAEFAASSQTVNENDGTVTLTLTRHDGSLGAIDVDYATRGGTATSNSDFTSKSGRIRFAAGETTKTITIALRNDTRTEAEEAFTVSLTRISGGATLGASKTTTVIIHDDEPRAPRVADVQLQKNSTSVIGLTIQFDSPMDLVSVTRRSSYSLKEAGRNGRLGTADDRSLSIASVTYNASTNTATLTFSRAVTLGTPIRLKIASSTILGVTRLALDGDANDVPGGSFQRDI